jgi:DNA-binding transcriptional LysR family regulator
MSPPLALDLDLLRTFALIAEEGSFTLAAKRVGRTQSAVSLQVQRLEAQVGYAVLVRGRGGAVQLTPQGSYLLGRARELLALNDEIVGSLRTRPNHAEVRFGVPEVKGGLDVPKMLQRFSETCPEIAVEAVLGPSCALVPLLKAGHLDLMLCETGIEPRQWPTVEVWRGPVRWITSEHHTPHLMDPLPLSLPPGNCPWRPPWLDECLWRGDALKALDRIGRRYRIVSTSTSLTGMHTPVLAGRAVTVSTLPGLPEGLRPVGEEEGLPELPDTGVLLLKAREPRQPVTDLLASHIEATFELRQ